MTGGIQLEGLTLKGTGVPDAHVSFGAGLNVIVGASNTGKTFIAQCIDFMFGSSRTPKPIPQVEPYETVELSLRLAGRAAVLTRSLRGGDFWLTEPGEPTRLLAAKHQSGNEDTASHVLLAASGLAGKKVRQNQQGKTRDLSFRDVSRLVLVDETSVIAERSPIFTGTPHFRTVEAAVFRLFLTGVDDSSVIAKEDPKVAKGKREGKSELLESLLEKARAQLMEHSVTESAEVLGDKLKRLDETVATAAAVLSEQQRSASTLEDRRRAAWQQLREVDSRLAVLAELQKRFALLQEQYASDLRRLETVYEASVRLGQMQEERCPVCGSLAEHHELEHQGQHASPEDVAAASTAEAAKTRTLLADLQKTIEANGREISQLEAESGTRRTALDEAGGQLADSLRPRIQEALQKYRNCAAERDKVREALDMIARVDELEAILADLNEKPKRQREEGPSTLVGADAAEDFTLEVETLLRSWQFPGLGRVTFSEKDQDIVLSGQRRASHGKGVRAITHAAFSLALLRYCRERSKPHPGLVLIDSPLIVYRQPDAGEDAFSPDVKQAFYQVLSKEYRDSQVVIMENDSPPPNLEGVSVIEFTGAEHGRPGFIPAM